MTNKEYFKKLIDVERTQENHNDFYELAEKYGFSTPWCNGSTSGFDPENLGPNPGGVVSSSLKLDNIIPVYPSW